MESSLLGAPHNEETHFGAGITSPDATNSGRRRLSGGPHASSIPRIRRRNRLITSCLECRRRKLKCDKLHPCTNCTRFVRDCVFLAPALDAASQLKLNEIKEKMGTLERTLEEDVARQVRAKAAGYSPQDSTAIKQESSEDEDDVPEDEKNLDPTPLAIHDAAYYDDAIDDDVLDLGVLIGKLRLTERVGGFVRPKFSQEMNYVLKERTETADYTIGNESRGPSIRAEYDIAKPAMDFMAPSSSFFFAPEPQKSSFMIYLPSKNVADSLLNHYWKAVHPISRVVHRPSFERQWGSFWQQVHGGVEPVASMQALVMGALLSATISLSEQAISMQLGVPKVQLLRSFQQGAESALCRANFLRTTKFQTLQALVMYLIPMCRREVTRAHSALTGTVIRLAECMGLHRDGSHYGLSAVEVHVRRIVWYQLCFLDIRTCEATGPRPQIHEDDFDTKLPLNVNDADLEAQNPPTEDSDTWTDMTCSLVRFECNEMQRYAWATRPRIEKKKISLTKALSKIQDFLASCDQKYLPMFDRPEPIARMALLIYKIMSLRLYIMFLHRYMSGRGKLMPERLRKMLLTACVQQIECAMLIETEASLRLWAWYIGAIHQYHSSLILLSEGYASDVRYFEDRAWKCLDFVFETNPQLPRKDKAKTILTDIVQKTEVYSQLRRIRAPQEFEKAMVEEAAAHAESQRRTQQQNRRLSTTDAQDDLGSFGQPRHGSWLPTSDNQAPIAPIVLKETPSVVVEANSPTTTSSETTAEMLRGQGISPGTGGSPTDAMVDVDWNEWDKLFPQDEHWTDFGNLPDASFSTMLPENSFHFPNGPSY